MTTLSRRTMLHGAAALPAIAIASPLVAAAAASADAHLIALGERLEGLLLRYVDAHLEWSPLLSAAHAERDEKLNGADWKDLSHDERQAAIRLLDQITDRNGCSRASDRTTALADEIEPLRDAIVAAEASTLAGLRAKALAALWEARPSSFYGELEFPEDGGATRSLFDAVAGRAGLTPMVREIEARLAAAAPTEQTA